MIVLEIVVFMFIAYLGSTLVMGSYGPWAKLAKQFKASSPPPRWANKLISGTVGFGSYRSVLNVTATSEGLYLGTNGLMPWHSVLFIPKSAISRAQIKEVLWSKSVALTIGNPKITTIQLPYGVLDSLAPSFANLR